MAVVASTWIGYDRIYGRGGDRRVAWTDITRALEEPAFARPAARSVESARELHAALAALVRGRVASPPRVDFHRRRALLVTVGPRSSSGYALEVIEVREERRRLVLRVRERTPAITQPVEPRVTYPFVLITVPNSTKPLAVEWEGR